MAEMRKPRKLVLENGAEFVGTGFGADTDALSTLVFHTAMVGYQEVITDPANAGRMVMMTYPLIGGYGINDEDSQSRGVTVTALIVRELCETPSNFRYTETLGELLEESGIPGLQGIDTREVTRILRDEGAMRAMLCDADVNKEDALARIRAWQEPTDLVARRSCKKPWYARTFNPLYTVAAVDTGISRSLLRELNARGCNVTVMPCTTSADAILALHPDGILLPDGPGNPADVPQVADCVKALAGKLPMLGIGLGCQLIALAKGAKIIRLPFGHNGGNQPVREEATGAMTITSQGHLYAIDAASLEGTGLHVTHTNLMDGTVEGIAGDKLTGLQYQGSAEALIAMMEEEKQHA